MKGLEGIRVLISQIYLMQITTVMFETEMIVMILF